MAQACIFLATKAESGVQCSGSSIIRADYAVRFRQKPKYRPMCTIVDEVLKYRKVTKKTQDRYPKVYEVQNFARTYIIQPDIYLIFGLRVVYAQEYSSLKDELHIYERILLMTLSFDIKIIHPYEVLMRMAREIIAKSTDAATKNRSGEQTKKHMRNTAQIAWNFVNDSFRTVLCLQFSATKIASATVFMALRMQNYRLKNRGLELVFPEKQLLTMFESAKAKKQRISQQDIFRISKGIYIYI